mmetsp:Transcript_62247/g.140787  ORF Transcript_62247/g.140787 Transcript_62247/m.140787 type:complete len:343 (+) Transcript_62247:1816-2844(+)
MRAPNLVYPPVPRRDELAAVRLVPAFERPRLPLRVLAQALRRPRFPVRDDDFLRRLFGDALEVLGALLRGGVRLSVAPRQRLHGLQLGILLHPLVIGVFLPLKPDLLLHQQGRPGAHVPRGGRDAHPPPAFGVHAGAPLEQDGLVRPALEAHVRPRVLEAFEHARQLLLLVREALHVFFGHEELFRVLPPGGPVALEGGQDFRPKERGRPAGQLETNLHLFEGLLGGCGVGSSFGFCGSVICGWWGGKGLKLGQDLPPVPHWLTVHLERFDQGVVEPRVDQVLPEAQGVLGFETPPQDFEPLLLGSSTESGLQAAYRPPRSPKKLQKKGALKKGGLHMGGLH